MGPTAATDLSNIISLSFPFSLKRWGAVQTQTIESIIKVASAGQSCRFLSAHYSKIVRHTFWQLRVFFPAEIVCPALPPVSLRFPLRDEVHTASKCHFIHTAEYLPAIKSVQEFSYSSDPFAFRLYRNSHRDARAQKLLLWEEAQKKPHDV